LFLRQASSLAIVVFGTFWQLVVWISHCALGKPDADRVGFTHRLAHGADDFHNQTQAFSQRTAVAVLPFIEMGTEELVQQVAVGTMNLDIIEACCFGICGRSGKAVNIFERLFRQRGPSLLRIEHH
jgi:hypothetical protein